MVGTKLSCHGKSAQISGHLFEARSVKWAIDLHQSYWQSHGILTLGRLSNLSSKKCTGNIVSTGICDVRLASGRQKCCVCGKIGIVLQKAISDKSLRWLVFSEFCRLLLTFPVGDSYFINSIYLLSPISRLSHVLLPRLIGQRVPPVKIVIKEKVISYKLQSPKFDEEKKMRDRHNILRKHCKGVSYWQTSNDIRFTTGITNIVWIFDQRTAPAAYS